MPEHKRLPIYTLLIYGMAAGLVFLTTLYPASSSKALTYTEFIQEVRDGKVEAVEVSNSNLIGKLKKPEGSTTDLSISTPRLPNMDEAYLMDELIAQDVKIIAKPTTGWGGLVALFVPVFLLVLVALTSRAKPLGASGVAKSKAKIYDEYTRSNVTFADVAGVDEAEAELIEVVDFLKTPQKYTRLGGRIPKGVLLVGPPGTGKTLLAKAVAGEAKAPFFSISGSEFMEIFVGVGAARVRDLFEQAKRRAPCIVFIDELDAIGKSRATGRGILFSNDEREQTLNQLLAEMDGFDSSAGVIIMAATNTPEVLDQALLRAGRFDRHIIVDRPDIDGREAILKVHTSKVALAPNADLRLIASRTPGMVGADLANIINEAALLAARRQAVQVEMFDIEEAIDRVMLGLEKKNRVMSAAEKRRVAFHESGHALVALTVDRLHPVHRISIIPRSVGALGHTLQLPTEEHFLMTRTELRDQLAVMLGGRAAEDIVFNSDVSTGAADDLERASELARQMVTRFGMSEKLGHLTYGKPLSGRFLQTAFASEDRNYSEKTAQAIDEEVRLLIEECYERSRTVLFGRREELEHVAETLMERETLDRSALDAVIASAHTAVEWTAEKAI